MSELCLPLWSPVGTVSRVMNPKMLVTGGMDRLIRLWHPHFPGKPTGILKGHSAPIFFLWISSEDSQIVSVSVDCTVKDECCLFTGESKASSIYGEISACHYSPAMKSLYIAADSIAVLKLKPRSFFPRRRLTESHNEPVLCCCYSEEFRQVVSCGEGSVLKVWDLDTGRQGPVSERSSHGATITCMTMDDKGRRLITGRRDGSLKIWNFNSGQCLKTLKKGHANHCTTMQTMNSNNLYKRYKATTFVSFQINGHKDDILCVAHCPPSLLATSSCDGEIIVWNAVSGCILCRFVGPVEQKHHNAEVFCQKMPPSMFFHVYLFWSSLQIVDSDQVVLTSSTDHTVRLWSAYGECIGTFGQPEIWNIHVSSSWMHPTDPYEVLIDPLSMPNHGTLNGKPRQPKPITRDKTEPDRGELKGCEGS
uniref:WD40 repeat domain 95 n=1 Tax=Oryzias latipes TaxID=8090 RepID=H2LG37_ORYLA